MTSPQPRLPWTHTSEIPSAGCARHYVRQLPQETAPPVRFDVISVYLVPGKEKEFVHFEGSFGWSERNDYE